jgi:uncharacterized protein
MLNLSLTAVARGDLRVVGEVSPDDPLFDGLDFVLEEPVRLELQAGSVGEGVLVRGRIHALVELECRRCVKRVPYRMDEAVDILFERLEDEEAEDLAGEVYPLPRRGDDLDLRPALREQIVLRIPQFVVCSEECRGLCPQCGKDLNEGSCECVPEAPVSPWDALKNVKLD